MCALGLQTIMRTGKAENRGTHEEGFLHRKHVKGQYQIHAQAHFRPSVTLTQSTATFGLSLTTVAHRLASHKPKLL